MQWAVMVAGLARRDRGVVVRLRPRARRLALDADRAGRDGDGGGAGPAAGGRQRGHRDDGAGHRPGQRPGALPGHPCLRLGRSTLGAVPARRRGEVLRGRRGVAQAIAAVVPGDHGPVGRALLARTVPGPPGGRDGGGGRSGRGVGRICRGQHLEPLPADRGGRGGGRSAVDRARLVVGRRAGESREPYPVDGVDARAAAGSRPTQVPVPFRRPDRRPE